MILQAIFKNDLGIPRFMMGMPANKLGTTIQMNKPRMILIIKTTIGNQKITTDYFCKVH
jgi:hypothetical protein